MTACTTTSCPTNQHSHCLLSADLRTCDGPTGKSYAVLRNGMPWLTIIADSVEAVLDKLRLPLGWSVDWAAHGQLCSVFVRCDSGGRVFDRIEIIESDVRRCYRLPNGAVANG